MKKELIMSNYLGGGGTTNPPLTVNEASTQDLFTILRCSESIYLINNANLATSNEFTPSPTNAGTIFSYYDHPFNFNEVFNYMNDNNTIVLSTKDGSDILETYQRVVEQAGASWEQGNKNNSSCILYTLGADGSQSSALNLNGLPSGSSFTLCTIDSYDPSKTYAVGYAWGFIS